MRKMKGSVLFILSGLVSLILLEAAIRIVLPRPGLISTAEIQASPYVPHPVRGYALAPNMTITQKTADYEIKVSTNPFGLRGGPIRDHAGNWRILAVGDSFTFGYGVENSESWPAVLESILTERYGENDTAQVINGGVSAYSLRQIRLAAEELTSALKPKLLILGLYPSEYERITNPYVLYHGILWRAHSLYQLAASDDGILYSMYSPDIASIDLWFKQHFYSGAYLISLAAKARKSVALLFEGPLPRRKQPPSDPPEPGGIREKLTPMFSELEQINRFLSSKKIPLIVMLVNEQRTDGLFDHSKRVYNSVILEYCDNHNIVCVNPLPALEREARHTPGLRLADGDFHWTPRAHRIAAEELAVPVADILTLRGWD